MKWYNYVEIEISLAITTALLSQLDGKHIFYGHDMYTYYLIYYK
jgi:hypothetical protein